MECEPQLADYCLDVAFMPQFPKQHVKRVCIKIPSCLFYLDASQSKDCYLLCVCIPLPEQVLNSAATFPANGNITNNELCLHASSPPAVQTSSGTSMFQLSMLNTLFTACLQEWVEH